MRKGLTLLALLVAIAAFAVAIAAFLRKRGCILCDDLEDEDLLELCEDDDCCCDCCCPAEEDGVSIEITAEKAAAQLSEEDTPGENDEISF